MFFAQDKLTQQQIPTPMSFWPIVNQDQWCGRHDINFTNSES
jgi:hypothetical protein